MFTKKSLIFIVEDDIPYGKFVQTSLKSRAYENVRLFTDGNTCLCNMSDNPELVITDYHLKYMTGLKLLEKARKVNPVFHAILLSGVYQKSEIEDELETINVDNFIKKGNNDINKIIGLLDSMIGYSQYV